MVTVPILQESPRARQTVCSSQDKVHLLPSSPAAPCLLLLLLLVALFSSFLAEEADGALSLLATPSDTFREETSLVNDDTCENQKGKKTNNFLHFKINSCSREQIRQSFYNATARSRFTSVPPSAIHLYTVLPPPVYLYIVVPPPVYLCIVLPPPVYLYIVLPPPV